MPRRQTGRRKPGREARDARDARDARVRVAAGPVSIRLPDFARGHADAASLDLWVVHVREVGPPPAGAEPLEWVLLTNVPMSTTRAQAAERVEW